MILVTVTCDRTTSVAATSIGDMGVFEFLKEKTPGNLKICETVTAPAGTKIQVVCTLVDLIGGGTSSNHYLKVCYRAHTLGMFVIINHLLLRLV